MARKINQNAAREVKTITHEEAKRKNLPTAEFQSVMRDEEKTPLRVAYERRNRDLDPQLVWRGKDEQDWSDLVALAPPLYIQEKVKPIALINDLRRETEERAKGKSGFMADIFSDFNGLPKNASATEFYQHDANWSNRMILGDSLQVMASMAEREGLRGQVQCIYIDPPYGIKFNSNFQWSTTSRDVKDGKADHITREPEQVKAFRDTWRDGIHSYLTYLRDRLTVARDLLTDSGSIFVQIGDENVHRVRALMDEVFGEENFVSQITVRKTTSEGNTLLGSTCDFVLWFAKSRAQAKAHTMYTGRSEDSEGRYTSEYIDGSLFRMDNITSSRPAGEGDVTTFSWFGKDFTPGKGTFKTRESGLVRLGKADRFLVTNKGKLNYRRFQNDFGYGTTGNLWTDISGAVQSRSDPKIYVVQTSTSIIARCLLLATDPGDLVLDPTCGSGTTAYVAEQWGRRWITIDTSRVALALARARVMGARYPYYLLADSPEGKQKEAEITRTEPKSSPSRGDIRQGFVYERVPHITLKSIANNAEIDVIWDKYLAMMEPVREKLNAALGRSPSPSVVGAGLALPKGAASGKGAEKPWEEWEITRQPEEEWSAKAKELHAEWWRLRIARQKEMDASIAGKAEYEYLYDKPYDDKRKVRVAGPFTVESLSPHRVLTVDENDELVTEGERPPARQREEAEFAELILENLRTAGVQQAHKENRITFTHLTGWPGRYICAEGRYMEGEKERRAGIFIGPEFGTVSRPDLVAAAREAGDAGFDAVIACAFNYDAHSSEFDRLGKVPMLKARMNADLHMADELKNTGKGNLFVIFGEPDIEVIKRNDGMIQVKINGVDVFHPQSGEIQSSGPDGIACWFIDTDYNEESFFVRHAYFLGANDPYGALKTTLKAEIDQEAWDSLKSDTSRPFPKPKSGRFAVKVINHLGDEVMKVFGV
jgi:adenine-specific DNA-methyltransferase